MRQINCHIPIKLRITGRLSDAQLDQLGEQLVRALTARISFAERTIASHNSGRTTGGEVEIVREEYNPTRLEPGTNSYFIPSFGDEDIVNIDIYYDEPDWLRWWRRRLLVPENIHHDLITAVFEQWHRRGLEAEYDRLFMQELREKFYKAFCQQVALAMLDESFQNMNEFLRWLGQNESDWKRRFAMLIQLLSGPAERYIEIRDLPTQEERTELEALERDFEREQRFRRGQPGGERLPGGFVNQERLNELRERINRIEEENRQLFDLLQAVQGMEPFLVLLTLEEGREYRSTIESALIWAAEHDPDFLLGHIRRQVVLLGVKSLQATVAIQMDEEVAYRLGFVQEVANEILAPWLESNAYFREAIEDLISGPPILVWLGMGITLLIITFIFPPLGIGLSAALGVGLAVNSVQQAMQLSRLEGTRIAQFGFRPLVSREEVSAATMQAAIDIFFAALDIGAVVGAASRSLRNLELATRLPAGAARDVADTMGRALERFLSGWRRLDQWPEELTQSIRQQVIEQLEHAHPNWRAGLTIEQSGRQVNEIVETVQQQLISRYEQRLLGVQNRFQQALEAGEVGDIQAWLARELPDAREFFAEIIGRDFRPGNAIFEDIIAGHLTGQIPPPASTVSLRPIVSEAERATSLGRLEEMAAATTRRGGPTAAAQQIRSMLEQIQAHPSGARILEEIANVAAREGDDVAGRILRGLYSLENGPQPRDLEAVAEFLQHGGEGRVLSEILNRGASWSNRHFRRNFLEVVRSFQANELRGISVVMANRGYNARGADAVINIAVGNRYGDPRAVFRALNDLAPHSEGLDRVISYLSSLDQNLNQAGLGHLFAARRLLEEFPSGRIVFEVPVESAGRLIREIDISVVTPHTRVPILEAELKEVTSLFTLGRAGVRRQFARDIVRSVQTAGAVEAPLARIRWLIRERELIAEFGSREAVRNELRPLLREAFNHSELGALTAAQREAALRDFEENFERIVHLF